MSRRDKKKPPRPGMKWSKKHRMWVDADTRTAERRAKDEKISKSVEADQERIKNALRQVAEAREEQAAAIESAATTVARTLLASLIEARKKAGFSQAEVARRMGVSQPVIVRLESGTHSPTLSTLARYAAAIGVKLDVSRSA